MHKITEVTRNKISELFLGGLKDYHTGKQIFYQYSGRLNEIEFLSKFFPLTKMPSNDSRCKTFEEEIQQHRLNNDDKEDNWIFEDDRFELKKCEDDKFLSFVIHIFRPEIRDENKPWEELLKQINELIKIDGYEIYTSGRVSNQPEYAWRPLSEVEILTGKFAPFSIRNKKVVTDKNRKISLPMKVRKEIFKLICKYNDNTFTRDDDTGITSDIMTKDKILVDIRKFYPPKSFNRNGVETYDIEEFIFRTSPYSVFDAIEIFSQYNKGTQFPNELNAILPQNITYKLIDGKLQEAKLPILMKEVVKEDGLKELIEQAQSYYNVTQSRDGKQIAIEKLWDAFERLKSYYVNKGKKESCNQIITEMSHDNAKFKEIFDSEFRTLSEIGNSCRIRHSERGKVDITDGNYYDYLFKRCIALIELALKYLK